jgi:hypothetical protein
LKIIPKHFQRYENRRSIAETVTLGFTLLLNPTASNCGDKMRTARKPLRKSVEDFTCKSTKIGIVGFKDY